MISKCLRAADFLSKPKDVYAHCDVPCGIYETDTMTHAVETVISMVKKLNDLEMPGKDAGKEEWLEYYNTVARMVATKEEFAHKCKTEVLILWTDHFKEEHLEKFPDLHEKIWKATKLCSKAKRNVDMKIAEQLKEAVEDVAEIFKKSKQ